jgi:rhodanese-related sulfurtransferase
MHQPPHSAANQRLPVNPEWEVHPTDVARRKAAAEDFLLLDVRQHSEWVHAHIAGATLLPLPELAEKVDQLVDYFEKSIVVYCHHGGRSLAATKYLRQRGFLQVHSMAGGIDAWSQIVDPTLRRY